MGAHAAALERRAVQVVAERAVRDDGDLDELVRVVSTFEDDGTSTLRHYQRFRHDSGRTEESFRGVWYRNGEARVRLVDGGHWVFREPDEPDPPAAPSRLDEERLAEAVAPFEPTVEERGDAFEISADRLSEPTGIATALAEPTAGRLTGLVERDAIARLHTEVVGIDASSESATYDYVVTDADGLETGRPTAGETAEWVVELRQHSPIAWDG